MLRYSLSFFDLKKDTRILLLLLQHLDLVEVELERLESSNKNIIQYKLYDANQAQPYHKVNYVGILELINDGSL